MGFERDSSERPVPVRHTPARPCTSPARSQPLASAHTPPAGASNVDWLRPSTCSECPQQGELWQLQRGAPRRCALPEGGKGDGALPRVSGRYHEQCRAFPGSSAPSSNDRLNSVNASRFLANTASSPSRTAEDFHSGRPACTRWMLRSNRRSAALMLATLPSIDAGAAPGSASPANNKINNNDACVETFA